MISITSSYFEIEELINTLLIEELKDIFNIPVTFIEMSTYNYISMFRQIAYRCIWIISL
jgi:hypothetical protein